MSEFSEIISHIRSVAEVSETDAAFSGDSSDGGCKDLLNQVHMFECGLAGILPPSWTKYKQQVEAKHDPDRAAYERYKKKYS